MSGGGANAMNNLPPGVNPENNLMPGGPIINQGGNRNRNNNQNPLFNVRERLFHALFFKFALAYARTFPRPIRRFFEFLVLLKALVAFFVLAYIHIAFSRTPTTCLNHIKDSWPRDGILRVEILRNPAQDYTVEQSYAKERKLKRDKEELNSMLGMLTTEGFYNIESSTSEDIEENEYLRDGTDYGNITRIHDESEDVQNQVIETGFFVDSKPDMVPSDGQTDLNQTIMPGEKVEPTSSIWEGILGLVEDIDRDSKIVDESLEESAANDSSKDEDYILEYSLEYGFLRLSPSARLRLKIPVKIVTLDPQKDECFGDTFSRFVLDEFLGYDDLLMASIKSLAEQEDNKGYLRLVYITTDCDSAIKPMTLYAVMCYSGISGTLNILLTFIVTPLGKKKSTLLIFAISLMSGIILLFIRIPILSIIMLYFFLYVVLVLGNINTYLQELNPTYLRGMATCLSVVVARGFGFFSIQIIGSLLGNYCTQMISGYILLMFTGIIVTFFLPSDKSETECNIIEKTSSVVENGIEKTAL